MKTTISRLSLLCLMIFSVSFYSCEGLFNTNPDDDDKKDELYVKFCNEPSSEYTITSIEVRPRGPADGTQTPTDNWSTNILPAGTTIDPGGHVFFTLEIPSLHWSEYRLKVDDGEGNIIAVESEDLPITHWGDDTRTVGVTIIYDQHSDMIVVNGWSDFVGIDE
jgi:hypothetical protein